MSVSLSKFLSRLTVAMLIAGLALAATGCGNSGASKPVPLAKTQIKIGDTPADSVLAFELKVSSIDLVQQSGAGVNVLSTPTEVELTHLAGTVEPLVVADVPAGTYGGAAIAIATAEVTYLPSGSNAPVEKEFSLNTTINVSFSPAINLAASPSILNFDVSVAQSISFDQNGNVTGINPAFTATTSSVAPPSQQSNENGKAEDMIGVVSNITPASGTTPASFSITPQSGGPDQSFVVDGTTKFDDGLAQFSDLQVGMMIEVGAVSQSDGSLLATAIELVEASDGFEADGIVTATSGSPVTSLSLLTQDEMGNFAADLLGTTVNVDVSAAVFQSPLKERDFAALLQGLPFSPRFDSTSVGIGQRIEVNGASMGPVQSNFSANNVTLKQQALTGTVAPAANGSNASFSLLLNADSAFFKLTGVSSLNVYQVATTELQEMTSVGQGNTVRIRGLLLFDGTNYQFVASRITLP
jgi:hypothetical protein